MKKPMTNAQKLARLTRRLSESEERCAHVVSHVQSLEHKNAELALRLKDTANHIVETMAELNAKLEKLHRKRGELIEAAERGGERAAISKWNAWKVAEATE